MQPVTNILLKVSGVDFAAANDPQRCSALLHDIASVLEMHVITETSHTFSPHGYTGVLLLAESHASIHTWPEHNFLVVELLTCKPFATAEITTLEHLVQKTFPDSVTDAVLSR